MEPQRTAGLHHLAIGTPHLPTMADFYSSVPGLEIVAEQQDASGTLRSLWLRAGDVLLMLESATVAEGPRALVLALPREEGPAQAALDFAARHADGRTEFTVYFRDPDGNRLGYSTHPERLRSGEP